MTTLPYVMRDQVNDQVGQIMSSDRDQERYASENAPRREIEVGLFTLFVVGYLVALAFNA